MNQYFGYIKEKFDFLSYVTPLFTSAIDGKRVEEILKTAKQIKDERMKRVKTGVFNAFLEQVTYLHAPTGSKKSHKPKIYY
jgi:GTP-binding protein